jgi:hypothetical protein
MDIDVDLGLGDNVFDEDLGQDLDIGQGMDQMDFISDLFSTDTPFDQPMSPLGTSHDRTRQSSRTNDPSSVRTPLVSLYFSTFIFVFLIKV